MTGEFLMKKIRKTQFERIRYLDGDRLKNALIASIGLIAQNRDFLNKINVFPVPDGDTGTNMFLTMNRISSGITGLSNSSVAVVSSQVAEAALMGAQGNSGAILAQFFHGFAEGVRGKLRLTTKAFASAVQDAKGAAYAALKDPREGTILSVINDWANQIQKTAQKTEDFVELLKNGLQIARTSLIETTKKLEVLRKAGVVDAGAQGFVYFLEGIVNFIDKGKIKKIIDSMSQQRSMPAAGPVIGADVEIKFRYCTECMLTGETISQRDLKDKLADLGDSLIVAGGAGRVRIHIHTDSPEQVFRIARRCGEISGQKIDDMKQQHRDIYLSTTVEDIGIVTDSSCDLPAHFLDEHHVHTIPLQITFGTQTFLDKVQLSTAEFYEKLVSSPVHPTTSQPSPTDIKQVFDKIAPRYHKILSIHLPRASSGTLQVVENAAREFGDKIICIDGNNISGALGLVVMEAAAAVKEGLSLEEVIRRVNEAVANIRIFISLATVDYLVKGGRLSRPKGLLAKVLKLNPVVSFDREGHVVLAAKAFGEKNSRKKALDMAVKQARSFKRVKFLVAHADAYAGAEWAVSQLTQLFDIKEDIRVVEAAPALGVHAGPGTIGIAFIGYND